MKIMSKPLEDSDAHPEEKKGNYFCGWLKWKKVVAVDLRWNQLLQKQDSFLTFVLNATQDSLPTPSRLKCWQQESAGDGKCPLGCGRAGTLKHILCGCEKALDEKPQSRITWRHDSILLAWQRGVVNQVEVATKARRVAKPAAPIQFKSHGILHTEEKGGKEVQCPPSVSWEATRSEKPSSNVLESAQDWKVQFDIDLECVDMPKNDKPFPSEIAIISGEGSRPDGVVWSMETKTVIILELTSPWEENVDKRHKYKMAKYNQLIIDLRDGKHNDVRWKAELFCIEVGARGAYHEMAWGRMCKTLGFTRATRKALLQAMQDAAIQCSHFIFLCRFHKKWEPQALRDTWRNPGKSENQ